MGIVDVSTVGTRVQQASLAHKKTVDYSLESGSLQGESARYTTYILLYIDTNRCGGVFLTATGLDLIHSVTSPTLLNILF